MATDEKPSRNEDVYFAKLDAELIKEQRARLDAERTAALAERNAVRLMTLIEDILDLERLETGKMELQITAVPAASVLRRAMESLAAFGAPSLPEDVPPSAVGRR